MGIGRIRKKDTEQIPGFDCLLIRVRGAIGLFAMWTLLLMGSVIVAGLSSVEVRAAIAVSGGSGTIEDPWQIGSLEDLETVRQAVLSGYTFKGEYLKLEADIDLPEGWEGLGDLKEGAQTAENGINILPFSGTFDGNDYTVRSAHGGGPLFGYVRQARIQNLRIAGTYINGNGLINHYVRDNGPAGRTRPKTARIENVTIVSGTSIKGSGFVSGYATASNVVNITGCIVEDGVIIGCDKDAEKVGSFGGDYNGTITNCKSAATVCGTSYVGGIIGCKGNSMSQTSITNCIFTGSVIASGNNAGGIAGGGYGGTYWGIHSAPNAPMLSITNCLCTGNVEAADRAGGIEGYETSLQTWENGKGNLCSNLFTGTVKTTQGGWAGGIVGALRGIDRYNCIKDNYYLDGCGANRGIGGVEYVDTSCIPHEEQYGLIYMDTSKKIPVFDGVNDVYTGNILKDHNRTDDPLGADAALLAQMFTSDQLASGIVTTWLNAAYMSQGNWNQWLDYPEPDLAIDFPDQDIDDEESQPEDPADEDGAVKKGMTCKAGGNTYLVTKTATKTERGSVTFTRAKNAKKITVPESLVLADKNRYIVTVIGGKAFRAKKIRKVVLAKSVKKMVKNAFSGSGAVLLVIKTKLLNKSTVRGSLRSSKIGKIKVSVGSRGQNAKYVKKYKRIFTKKTAGRSPKLQ